MIAKLLTACGIILAALQSAFASECSEAYSYVNPFIGSGGPGFGYGEFVSYCLGIFLIEYRRWS